MSISSFKQDVLTIVQSIPRGSVLSYGEVARRAGNVHAARAVGAMMRANYDSSLPCHRVVASNGTLGGFNKGSKEKLRRLKAEGVLIRAGKIVA